MMISPLASVGLMLSYKCNSKCRHCLFCCSSEWSEWMDIDLVRKICEGTTESTEQVHGFHFAGGEAFLNFALLLESIKTAADCGIAIEYVETNAGWYRDEDSALDKLSQLRDAGLNCLFISVTPFHCEHIPLKKTLGTIRASLNVFGSHRTIIARDDFLQDLKRITDSGTVTLERYAQVMGETKARQAACFGGKLVPGGRSSFALVGYLAQQPIESCFGGNCSYDLLQSGHGHIDPYGNIIPAACAGISIGDAHDLPSAYNNFSFADNPVIEILCTSGVQGLYEMAVRNYDYLAKKSYAGKCDLCVDIRRHLVLNEAPFEELTPKEFYRRI